MGVKLARPLFMGIHLQCQHQDVMTIDILMYYIEIWLAIYELDY